MSQLHPACEAMVDRKVLGVGPSSIDITYQRLGEADAPPVLLIMGGGAQLIHWPDDFCCALVDRGLQVIRFDNRDSGLSSHFSHLPPPDFPAVMQGDFSSVAYTLSDMAGDATGLLDALGVGAAHIVGASMGGQIAQTIAIEHPERVLSLTCMMSTTGNAAVGQVAPEIMREVFGAPVGPSRAEVVEHRVRAMRAIGSPAYPTPEAQIAERAGQAYDRSYDPLSIMRHGAASLASGDRTEKLRELRVPALVIHGLADRLVDPSGGRATAEAIAGAELELVEGMGHDIAPGLRMRLAERIASFVLKAERARSAR